MKQTIIFNLLLLVSTSLFAQVGIGTTTPKAILEVVSPTSGMLIPRYSTLASANSKSLPTLNATDHRGLMIYIEEAINRGFWFYDGSAFVKVGALTGTTPIANGGTGATTAGSALNALLPAQSGNADKVLTSDGTNTSWQKPVGRTRSISLGAGDIDIGPGSGIFTSPTKEWVFGITPVIAFPDKSNKTLQILVPIPADWNGTSPFTLTGFYSSLAQTGDFYLSVGSKFRDLHSNIIDISNICGRQVIASVSSNSNEMMQFTVTLCSEISSSGKLLHIYITRAGADDTIDTVALDFNLLGLRIDYQD